MQVIFIIRIFDEKGERSIDPSTLIPKFEITRGHGLFIFEHVVVCCLLMAESSPFRSDPVNFSFCCAFVEVNMVLSASQYAKAAKS